MFYSFCFAALVLFAAVHSSVFNVTVAPNGTHVFAPVNITIKVNDTVNWVWGGNGHNVRSGQPCTWDHLFGFNLTQSAPYQYNFTFNTTGYYPYFCSPHCASGMQGTVNVTATGPANTTTTSTSASTTTKVTTTTSTSTSTGNHTTGQTSTTSGSSTVFVASLVVIACAITSLVF